MRRAAGGGGLAPAGARAGGPRALRPFRSTGARARGPHRARCGRRGPRGAPGGGGPPPAGALAGSPRLS